MRSIPNPSATDRAKLERPGFQSQIRNRPRPRENPFRSECINRLTYRATGFDWNALETRLRQTGDRGAIVGPKGHGKTTLLLEWMARDQSQPAVTIRLAEGQRSLTPQQWLTIAHQDRLFLDGAEQFGWWGWREFLLRTRKVQRLVITSHHPGFLPTIFTCQTSPELLAELVKELTDETIETTSLWQRHQGNLRLAFRELYDFAAERPPAKGKNRNEPHAKVAKDAKEKTSES